MSGLKKIYYGCLMPLWIKLLGHYHPQMNGLNYFTKIVTLIWQAVLKVWIIRNAHLHPGNPAQEDCSQLQATVNQKNSKHVRTLYWSRTLTPNGSWPSLHIRSDNGLTIVIIICRPFKKWSNFRHASVHITSSILSLAHHLDLHRQKLVVPTLTAPNPSVVTVLNGAVITL